MHYWANENPRWIRTVPFQHPWSVNCWCGIVVDHVIGPYFFEDRLTWQIYANFPQNVLPQLCSVFKTTYEWDFWWKVDKKKLTCSSATSFAKSNITRLLFMGFCRRTRNGGSTYHSWRHERKNTPSMYRNYNTNVGWRSFHQRINKCLQVEGHRFEHLL